MVINPKNSQKIAKWCLESAIGLILKATHLDEKISMDGLNGYFYDNVPRSLASKRQIQQMTYDLKRRHYISLDENNSVILTDRAKIRIIDTIVEARRDDGKDRIISFDIPEIKRTQRNGFRRAIKRMGFRQVQKSLWVCRQNVSDLVEAAISEYKVSNYVAYFIAENSNISQHITKILNKNEK